MRQKWNDDVQGQLYFSHGKANSCGVLTRFYGNINIVIKKQLNDKNGRILILDVTIDNNTNTEQHQLETPQNLSILLENYDNFYDKNVILAGETNYEKAISMSYNKLTGSF